MSEGVDVDVIIGSACCVGVSVEEGVISCVNVIVPEGVGVVEGDDPSVEVIDADGVREDVGEAVDVVVAD